MRENRRFGRRINLPSTAQIIHELKMLQRLDAVRLALKETPEVERREQILALETLLATPDGHDTPRPGHGMEMLRRGHREQELLRLLADQPAAA